MRRDPAVAAPAALRRNLVGACRELDGENGHVAGVDFKQVPNLAQVYVVALGGCPSMILYSPLILSGRSCRP